MSDTLADAGGTDPSGASRRQGNDNDDDDGRGGEKNSSDGKLPATPSDNKDTEQGEQKEAPPLPLLLPLPSLLTAAAAAASASLTDNSQCIITATTTTNKNTNITTTTTTTTTTNKSNAPSSASAAGNLPPESKTAPIQPPVQPPLQPPVQPPPKKKRRKRPPKKKLPNQKRKSPAVPWKKPKDMPKRPLSGYNLFFREQREFIMADRKSVLESNVAAAAGSTTAAAAATTGSGTATAARATATPASTTTSPSKTSSGTGIGFENLAKTIAAKWKALHQGSKQPYQDGAAKEKARYDKEMLVWRTKEKAKQDALKREEEARGSPETDSVSPLEDDEDDFEDEDSFTQPQAAFPAGIIAPMHDSNAAGFHATSAASFVTWLSSQPLDHQAKLMEQLSRSQGGGYFRPIAAVPPAASSYNTTNTNTNNTNNNNQEIETRPPSSVHNHTQLLECDVLSASGETRMPPSDATHQQLTSNTTGPTFPTRRYASLPSPFAQNPFQQQQQQQQGFQQNAMSSRLMAASSLDQGTLNQQMTGFSHQGSTNNASLPTWLQPYDASQTQPIRATGEANAYISDRIFNSTTTTTANLHGNYFMANNQNLQQQQLQYQQQQQQLQHHHQMQQQQQQQQQQQNLHMQQSQHQEQQRRQMQLLQQRSSPPGYDGKSDDSLFSLNLPISVKNSTDNASREAVGNMQQQPAAARLSGNLTEPASIKALDFRLDDEAVDFLTNLEFSSSNSGSDP